MGKAIGGLPEAAPLAAPAEAEESFALGSWLTRQRELRGISREELSALTRLPMRSLERLESGAFDGQQDGFVRGFVRTVAVAIGLDPDDAVARLLAEPAARPRQRGLDPRRVAVAAVGCARRARAVRRAGRVGAGAARPDARPRSTRRSCGAIRCARSPSSTGCWTASRRRTMPTRRSRSSPRPRPTPALRPRSRRPRPPRSRHRNRRRGLWPRSTPRRSCFGRSPSASRTSSCTCSRPRWADCRRSPRARDAAGVASRARST